MYQCESADHHCLSMHPVVNGDVALEANLYVWCGVLVGQAFERQVSASLTILNSRITPFTLVIGLKHSGFRLPAPSCDRSFKRH